MRQVRIKPDLDLIYRSVAGTHLLVATGKKAETSNRMIELNETAAFLWQALDKNVGSTKEALLKDLTDAYEVSDEMASADIEKFVTNMNNLHAITLCMEDM